jgi:hypothetical protein
LKHGKSLFCVIVINNPWIELICINRLRTMNTMRASDELNEEQARQLSFDLERSYASFMAFLNK